VKRQPVSNIYLREKFERKKEKKKRKKREKKEEKNLHQTINERVMFSRQIVRNFIRTDIVKSSNWTFDARALTSLMIVSTGWTNLALVIRLKSSLVRVFANGTFTLTSLNSHLACNF